MLLVGENVTLPLMDGLLFANPYRVSHLKISYPKLNRTSELGKKESTNLIN